MAASLHLCVICSTPCRRRFCSARCSGAGERRASEARFNLRAFDEWSPDMAYALGLFFADGCVTKAARGTGSWRVTLSNTDRATVEWWHAFLGNDTALYTHKPGKHGRKRVLWNSVTASDTLGERLIALGAVPRKSTEPIRMPNVPDGLLGHFLLGHFLRGFSDGDGSVGIHRNRKMKGGRNLVCTFTSNAAPFRADLGVVLDAIGARFGRNDISLRVAGSDAERLCHLMYGAGGPAMARKRAKWDEWVAFRATCGGLISESDPYESLRGLRPKSWHDLVGTMPDKELAARLGMSKSNVALVRKMLDVPPFKGPRTPSPRPWHALAGTMPDAEVARVGGVSPSMVCMYRKAAELPSFRSLSTKVF